MSNTKTRDQIKFYLNQIMVGTSADSTSFSLKKLSTHGNKSQAITQLLWMLSIFSMAKELYEQGQLALTRVEYHFVCDRRKRIHKIMCPESTQCLNSHYIN